MKDKYPQHSDKGMCVPKDAVWGSSLLRLSHE